MYAIFVLLWGTDADFLRPYALVSEDLLDRVLETVMGFGVDYVVRRIV